jgi:hypothetical protein
MSIDSPLPGLHLNRFAQRRRFLCETSRGLGLAALGALLPSTAHGAELPHFQPRARRVILLCQSGAPSQIDLLDAKPALRDRHGEELPDSIRQGQRLTTMTSQQSSHPITASPFAFQRYGTAGLEFSELLPHTARVADDLCVVRSLYTEAINHDPAITFLLTGSQQTGRPSLGSWLSYGLGSESDDLPTFLVMISGGEAGDQPLNGRLWGPGFLPPRHQGVKLRSGADPILFLNDLPGFDRATRRQWLDDVKRLNRLQQANLPPAEVENRIDQFELAFRMQQSVPELTDLSSEPQHTYELYGDDARQPGTFAANCLLARRMIERNVRFVQLYHRGWDHHQQINSKLPRKCRQVDQASAGLITDLKQRGLLNDTLVIWAGEFGRTVFCQGSIQRDDYGRDHHPRCFSIWLAGGGIRGGVTLGKTDDFSYNVVEDPVHVHDLQATILHCLGIDHERFVFQSQGRDFRLTDIAGNVVTKMLR